MTTRNKLLDKQIIIITGGIGSGKSYVMECLKELGFHIFNSDEAISDLVKPGGMAFAQVKEMFPDAVQNEMIDRTILSKLVFDDHKLLEKLEGVLYPLLRQHRAQWIEEIKAKSSQPIAIEIPLFFEKKVDIAHDLVLVTVCDIKLQKERALSRGKMDEVTIDAVLAHQVSNHYRINNADVVIDTNGSREETRNQVVELVF